MKTVGISAINKRIKDIANTFGTKSEVYKKAIRYLKNEVKDEYLAKDASGNITGIRQTKAAKADINRIRFHPEDLNEHVASVEKLIKDQMERFKDSNSLKEQELAKNTIKAIRTDFKLFNKYAKPIEAVYRDLNNYDSVRLEVYNVRDNKDDLDIVTFRKKGYRSRAQDLINDTKHTAAWVTEARKLVNDYDADINAQKTAWVARRYGKKI